MRTDSTASSLLSVCTYYVLSGTNLLGELTALHRAEVQVLVEEFSIQDVSHSILQGSPVRVQHSGPETQKESVVSNTTLATHTKL